LPRREALEHERLALVSDTALPRRLEAEEHVRGVSLLRASAGARLGLVAAAVVLLWLAVYWALT
jgi:hypothetical protein